MAKMETRTSSIRVLNLVIEDRNQIPSKVWVENFYIRPEVEDAEKMLREAVKEFLASNDETARKAKEYACGSFNWGDAISSIPESLFEKHGLVRMSGQDIVEVNVDHDEVLE